jgi:hypothetical protein
MKKTLILALLAAAALPAFAATTTVEFVPATGDKVVAVFSDDGTVTFNGSAPVAYTMDEAAKKICSTPNGTADCATFDTWGNAVGHSTGYTTDAGSSGVANVTATTP